MRPNSKLRPHLRASRTTRAAGVLTALVGAAGVLLLSAPGSVALAALDLTHTPAATAQPNARHRLDYDQGMASWYYDSGSTACGFHAYHGVANRTLKCGTNVKFRYHGRVVNAVVDDRGPYVAGRQWDLGQSTASALHFSGVAPVWASVGR